MFSSMQRDGCNICGFCRETEIPDLVFFRSTIDYVVNSIMCTKIYIEKKLTGDQKNLYNILTLLHNSHFKYTSPITKFDQESFAWNIVI